MIESTLYYLGHYLMDRFVLPTGQVKFEDKEHLFRQLSSGTSPIVLPGIGFSIGDISFLMKSSDLNTTPNQNYTKVYKLNVIPVNLVINLVLISKNPEEYFSLIRRYISMKDGRFDVIFSPPESLYVEFPVSVSELSTLSTPPTGKEGKDYDRGVYYVLEGSFKINSYVIKDWDLKDMKDFSVPIIHSIHLNWDVFGATSTVVIK